MNYKIRNTANDDTHFLNVDTLQGAQQNTRELLRISGMTPGEVDAQGVQYTSPEGETYCMEITEE